METFKPGDVVMLKSGSPLMTITEVYNGNEYVYCAWYDFNTMFGLKKEYFQLLL